MIVFASKVLEPDMMTRGFAGLLFVRQGDHSPAIFYKTGRFELIKHEKVLLSDKIMEYAQVRHMLVRKCVYILL